MIALSAKEIKSRIPKKSKWKFIEFKKSKIGKDGKKFRVALFRCKCGNEKVMRLKPVINGYNLSCGCYKLIHMNLGYSIDEINEKKSEKSRWTAIKFLKHTRKGNISIKNVLCECSCGTKKVMRPTAVISNQNGISCGCHKDETIEKRKTQRAITSCYLAMIYRCYKRGFNNYYNYGGRGVKVCDEWRNDSKAFTKWALENGFRKGLQLDKDKLGDGMLYSPKTCCFLTRAENMVYRRNSVKYEYKGKMLTLRQIVDLEKFDKNKAIVNLRAVILKKGKMQKYRACLFIRKID